MNNPTYSAQEINDLKNTSLWYNCIINSPPVSQKKENTRYVLHATGDADMNGRKYISLPADHKLTLFEKRKYNIM